MGGGVDCCTISVGRHAESCPGGDRVRCPSGQSRDDADMCANGTPAAAFEDATHGASDAGGAREGESASSWECPSSHPYAFSGGVDCCTISVGRHAESCPGGDRVRCPSGQTRDAADMCAN